MDSIDSPLMEGLGLQRVVSTDPAGRAVVEYRVADHHCHAVAQGGYLTAWIDSAMARAVGAATNGEYGANTLEIKVSFFRPARRGQLVTAEGWLDKLGRQIAFAEGELRDEEGTVIAKGSSTIKLGKFSRPQSG